MKIASGYFFIVLTILTVNFFYAKIVQQEISSSTIKKYKLNDQEIDYLMMFKPNYSLQKELIKTLIKYKITVMDKSKRKHPFKWNLMKRSSFDHE
jgi:hypothetical protein